MSCIGNCPFLVSPYKWCSTDLPTQHRNHKLIPHAKYDHFKLNLPSHSSAATIQWIFTQISDSQKASADVKICNRCQISRSAPLLLSKWIFFGGWGAPLNSQKSRTCSSILWHLILQLLNQYAGNTVRSQTTPEDRGNFLISTLKTASLPPGGLGLLKGFIVKYSS